MLKICMPKFKLLIVDDFAPFRNMVRKILAHVRHIEIVGESSDGLEAVRQVAQLRPDVVVLDLHLPTLNGIQVARRISDLLPGTRILFVSVESSPDVVEEALRVGAGYIHKSRVAV